MSYKRQFKPLLTKTDKAPQCQYYGQFVISHNKPLIDLYELDWKNIKKITTSIDNITECVFDYETGKMTFMLLEYTQDDPGPFGSPRSYIDYMPHTAYISKAAAQKGIKK